MKKECEEFRKAFANAMKNEIDYSKATLTDCDYATIPDWVHVKASVEECPIEFSFMRSRVVFCIHNNTADGCMAYFTDDEKEELHKKLLDAYYSSRISNINDQIEKLIEERNKIDELKN